jgi:hypothetical protein
MAGFLFCAEQLAVIRQSSRSASANLRHATMILGDVTIPVVGEEIASYERSSALLVTKCGHLARPNLICFDCLVSFELIFSLRLYAWCDDSGTEQAYG